MPAPSGGSKENAPAAPHRARAADFDGNGKADLLWQDDKTRQVAVWFLDGPQGSHFQSFAWLANPGMPGWSVVATADFDGNGTSDLVWQNDSTRQAVVWYMSGPQGNQYQSFAWLQSAEKPGWKIVGAVDVNGDETPDLIWQEDSTRQVAAWYMGGPQGNQSKSFAWLQATNKPGWTVAGMADLDGNGKQDLIWQNDTTRQAAVWYAGGAQGTEYQSFSWLQRTEKPGWKIVGIVDLDGNGKPDLIWQNDTTRQVAVWYMQGPQGDQSSSLVWLQLTEKPGQRALSAH